MAKLGPVRLPSQLALGVQSSPFSIEGGVDNDWTAWVGSGRGGSRRRFGTPVGRDPAHWRCWEADLGRMWQLGLRSYRFGVDWARIEPRPGQFNLRALARYRAMTQWLLAHGIEPTVSLLHYSHPPWFHERCPWHKSEGEAALRFSDFTERVMDWLGDLVPAFITLNEPHAWATAAYVTGNAPPGYHHARVYGFEALSNLLRAHAAAAAVIRRRAPRARIGLAKRAYCFEPYDPASKRDQALAAYANQLFNHMLLDAVQTGRVTLLPGAAIELPRAVQRLLRTRIPLFNSRYRLPELTGKLDFIQVSYQTRIFAQMSWRGPSFFGGDRGDHGVSDDGEEIYPAGLSQTVMRMARHGLPLWVSCGLADHDDSRRPAFIYDHLGATVDAIQAGAPVQAFFYRGLLDGYEWRHGFNSRWGLIQAERDGPARELRGSARLMAQIAATRALPSDRPEAVPIRRIGDHWRMI